MKNEPKKAAIYSRKSKFTGKGESIENQVQICKQYGISIGLEDFSVYEDEGFSGKNLDRPEFKKLIQDARDKKFNALICYRLDRISRNISDFSNLINELQDLGIDFISVREQFDTTTPMGRAMMYIASVFAQLERETISERIRDNMLELAKTGRWLGGQTPLGFESEAIVYYDNEMNERKMFKLSPVDNELNIVKTIYELYLEKKSLSQVHKYLYINNIKTKMDAEWTKKKIQMVLRNPLYVKASDDILEYLSKLGMTVAGNADNLHGILTYNKSKGTRTKRETSEWIAAVSKHEGIIESDKWLEVQQILDENKTKAPRLGTSAAALLTGILKCNNCENNMFVKYGHVSAKTGKRFEYYACSSKDLSNGRKCNNPNVRVDEIEEVVIDKLKELTLDKGKLMLELKEIEEDLKSKENPNIAINSIEKSIEENTKKIQNLIEQLAVTPSLSKYISQEVEKIETTNNELKSKLEKLETENSSTKASMFNMDILIQGLSNFGSYVETEDFEQKRFLIHSIVDAVYWDGKTGNVEIRLLGTGKKK